jgi:TonB family protein
MQNEDDLTEHFRALEIAPGASLEEAKRAWRVLAKVWHPDRFPDDPILKERGRLKLIQLNEAYKAIETHYLKGGTNPAGKRRSEPPAGWWRKNRVIWTGSLAFLALFFAADVWLRFEERRRAVAAPERDRQGGAGVTEEAISLAEKSRPTPPSAVQPPPSAGDRPQPATLPRREATAEKGVRPADAPQVQRLAEDVVIQQIWEEARQKARAEASSLASQRGKQSSADGGARPDTGGRALRPKAISQSAPEFPKELESQGLKHGWAIVGFTVHADGGVADVSAVTFSRPEFGRAAVEGVRKWRFEPASKDGRKPFQRLEVPITFSVYVNDEAAASGNPAHAPTNSPKVRSEVRPIYPSRMKAAGVQGTVVVDFVVTKKGDVSEARVLSVTTSPELRGQALREAESQFGAAALSAVNQWKFQPGVSAGEPVDTQMQRPVSFILTEKVK